MLLTLNSYFRDPTAAEVEEMSKSEQRDGLVHTIAQWCGTNRISGGQKRSSDAGADRIKRAEKPDRHAKTSCPESALTRQVTAGRMTSPHNDVTGSSVDVDTADRRDSCSSGPLNTLFKVSGSSVSNVEEGFQGMSRTSCLRASRCGDLDPDGVSQSAASKPPAAPRIRKRGVTFKAVHPAGMQSSPASARTVSVDETSSEAISTVAPPSSGRRKLPNGRCRRFSDVMEHRQQLRRRRASCETAGSPGMVSSAASSSLSCATLPLSDVIPCHNDVTEDPHDVRPAGASSCNRQGSSGGRRSPNWRNRPDDKRDERPATPAGRNADRVKQFLRKLDSAPVPVLSAHSRRMILQRTRHCGLSYTGDSGGGDLDGSAGGGGEAGGWSRDGGIRVRSRSLSAADAPRRGRAGGGIVCANRDILRLQSGVTVAPSGDGKATASDCSASTGGKSNVKCEKSALGGSVVPWQGDDMVVNVSALGRAMERYLSGGLSSEDQ